LRHGLPGRFGEAGIRRLRGRDIPLFVFATKESEHGRTGTKQFFGFRGFPLFDFAAVFGGYGSTERDAIAWDRSPETNERDDVARKSSTTSMHSAETYLRGRRTS
jgi:hypothetical protein